MESNYPYEPTYTGHRSPSPCGSEENEIEIEHNPMASQFDDELDENFYTSGGKRDCESAEVGILSSGAIATLNVCRLLNDNNTNQAPILPRVNCPEKIILCLDVSSEMEHSTFRLGDGSVYSPLSMAKRAAEIFVNTKRIMDDRHEFALVLLKDSAVWVKDFVDDPQEIIEELHHVKDTQKCHAMNMTSLFQIILDKVTLPEVIHPEIIPPPYVVRVILIYGRSQCLPEFTFDKEAQKLLTESNYFFLDIFYLHEIPSENNKCQDIYQSLCDLDTRGTCYVFEVSRNTTRLYDAMAKLLAHPLQRPLQRDCQYKLNPLIGRIN